MRKQKLVPVAVAGTLAAAVLLAGTYAWQSVDQKARNQVREMRNPGARLHDDFNFTAEGNKDVYIENFTSKSESGVPVYARIRLDEYLEIGPCAGLDDSTPGKKVTVIKNDGDNPKLEQEASWTTYKWEREKSIEDGTTPTIYHEASEFRKYFLWNTDGVTNPITYMPTFNKNKDSLQAEINGTLEGKDGKGTKPYDDNVVYTTGQKVTDIAVYDADTDDKDELAAIGREKLLADITEVSGLNRTWNTTKLLTGGASGGLLEKITVNGTDYPIRVNTDEAGTAVQSVEVDLDNATEGYSIELIEEEHTAAQTLASGELISMETWMKPTSQGGKGRAAGNFWVYDEDGWVYWANKIKPEETTSLLLDQIELREDATIEDEYYYAINVVGQFSTRSENGEWTAFDNGTDTLSENAAILLNKIAGVAIEQYDVVIEGENSEENGVSVAQGGSINLVANSTNKTKALATWSWSIENQNSDTMIVYGSQISNEIRNQATVNVGMTEQAGDVLVVHVYYQDANGNYGEGSFNITVEESEEVTALRDEIRSKAQNVVTGTYSTYETIMIDGQDWWILAKNADETQALLFAKSAIDFDGSGTYEWVDMFGKSNSWEKSYIRQFLNSDPESAYANKNGFMVNFPHVAALAEEVTITTRSQVDSKEFTTTRDRVFLLSEADVSGKFSGMYNSNLIKWENVGVLDDDYTVKDSNGEGIALFSAGSNAQRKDPIHTDLWSWLRSPRVDKVTLAPIDAAGTINYAYIYLKDGGLRPAFWVDITENIPSE